jgi:hypothetical protein
MNLVYIFVYSYIYIYFKGISQINCFVKKICGASWRGLRHNFKE